MTKVKEKEYMKGEKRKERDHIKGKKGTGMKGRQDMQTGRGKEK